MPLIENPSRMEQVRSSLSGTQGELELRARRLPTLARASGDIYGPIVKGAGSPY